jgi:hypothetical protein
MLKVRQTAISYRGCCFFIKRSSSLTPDDLFEMAIRKGLHFNQSTQLGVVFPTAQ